MEVSLKEIDRDLSIQNRMGCIHVLDPDPPCHEDDGMNEGVVISYVLHCRLLWGRASAIASKSSFSITQEKNLPKFLEPALS